MGNGRWGGETMPLRLDNPSGEEVGGGEERWKVRQVRSFLPEKQGQVGELR